jgi:hypothetical protein
MERFIKWSGIIIITIALVMCGLYWSQMTKVRQDIMSKSDEDYILMVLRQKAADDCVLREIRPGVWSCTEWKTGKIFMVRR